MSLSGGDLPLHGDECVRQILQYFEPFLQASSFHAFRQPCIVQGHNRFSVNSYTIGIHLIDLRCESYGATSMMKSTHQGITDLLQDPKVCQADIETLI